MRKENPKQVLVASYIGLYWQSQMIPGMLYFSGWIVLKLYIHVVYIYCKFCCWYCFILQSVLKVILTLHFNATCLSSFHSQFKKESGSSWEIHQTRIVHIISGKDPDFGLQPEVKTTTSFSNIWELD